jgi:hypothetical protein
MTLEFPGFVDIQVNGFAGIDFNSADVTADQIREALAALRNTGVTRVLPTLITGPLDRFVSCVRTILAVDDPAIAGIHQEGPYISSTDGPRGAHPRAHTIPASLDDFKRRQEAADGRIVLVTLAPEVEGAFALIEYLIANGVRVAIGHSEATPAVIRDAIRAGATMSTHLGNGCASMIPRHTNLIWEQLASDELLASFIGEVACENDPRNRCHRCGRLPGRLVPDRRNGGRGGGRRARVAARNALPGRIGRDDARGRREYRALHGIADRGGAADGHDDSSGVHGDCPGWYGVGRVGSRAIHFERTSGPVLVGRHNVIDGGLKPGYVRGNV